jgi:DNA topoisomerase-1
MAQKWIVRDGSKTKGFRYKGPSGSAIKNAAELERFDALRIPPAWRDVHISTNPRGAIQVWGFDARGRKQYKYHRRAVEKGELRKYYRVGQMARDLPAIRARIQRDFRRQGLGKEKVCAGIVRLIGEGFFRVGSDKYQKENNTFGITTMRKSHVTILGDSVVFEYRGKRSITQRNVVTAKDLTRFVEALLETPGPRLFRYKEDGKWKDVDSHEVNDYIESVAQFPYTAKDFRTWGGTLRAATVLAASPSRVMVSRRPPSRVPRGARILGCMPAGVASPARGLCNRHGSRRCSPRAAGMWRRPRRGRPGYWPSFRKGRTGFLFRRYHGTPAGP